MYIKLSGMQQSVEDVRPSISTPVHRTLSRVKSWCIDTALPYWGDVGFDHRANAFHECLEFSGEPALAARRRTMVQGRQVYAFAHAAKLGWFPQGIGPAIRAAENMIKLHWSPDNQPGWVFSLHPDGTVADATRDMYTHAFALYGLAWAYTLTSGREFRKIADQTFAFVDSCLSSTGDDLSLHNLMNRERRQNPYMHLFEAALTWYEVTGDSIYIHRADEIFTLFTTRFFQPRTSILVEYFDQAWLPIVGLKGRSFEPGHHFEWVWLLHRYRRQTGRMVSGYTEPLFSTAFEMGFVDNAIAAEVQDDATIVSREVRVWPCTEALKAAAAEHEAGREKMAQFTGRLLRILERHFLGQPFAAGWLDHFNSDGSLKAKSVPASTLYHIVLGLAEADRTFNVIPNN
ncbi:hypothetical protein B5K03_09525 [Rhizobium phaseoli]|uniref:AGE family epimerase/isomerase n=1 Tax=Rhizobium phaseoli TaxID=396 RepID=UPI000D6730EC|nr:AGE family epimerase/isomerase [Rhizobium phaseoli]PWI54415.1 hypothetical protein B5K03_09525 [Rhizobium phaseoli]